MATWYVNSAVVGGTGSGNSWANAATTVAKGIANSASGDDLNIVYTHSETSATAITLTWKGVAGKPNRVFSCTTANSPATVSDLRTGATIATTGTGTITTVGAAYIFGVNFNVGNNASSASGLFGSPTTGVSSDMVLDSCQLNLTATSAQSFFQFRSPSTGQAKFVLTNTTVSCTAGSTSTIFNSGANLLWKNTLNAYQGPTVLNNLFGNGGTQNIAITVLDGLDLTGVPSGKAIFFAPNTSIAGQILNCKLSSGVSIVSAAPSASGAIIDLINSDSTATGYRQERYTYAGTLTASTSVLQTSPLGASDGVNAISWQITATPNATQESPFETFTINQWLDVGTYTANVQITSNSTLTNNDIWVDCAYLGNASIPISSFVSTAPATPLSTSTTYSNSASVWSGGQTTPQVMSLALTTATPGVARFTVKVGTANTVVYVDPLVVVS